MSRGVVVTHEVGVRFGRLVVTKPRYNDEPRIACRCDCGAERLLLCRSWGVTQSCGCLHDELAIERGSRAGMWGTPEYRAWWSMLDRCTNPTNKNYHNYGGRGISVCLRWGRFSAFLVDMGRRPAPHLSLDRINNDLGYGPNNCRWATASVQVSNRRRKGHCARGHPWNETNTRIYRGHRVCRACGRDDIKSHTKRKRERQHELV
jgi:hypothetical protein